MYNEIKTIKNIEFFLDKTNSLHDGYVINVHYANKGISIDGDTYYFNPEQTKLTLQILVTSICDTIIEIEFEYLKEWQIKDNQWEITDTTVIIDKDNWILWTDDVYVNQDELKNSSYVIAKAMKWRVVE